MKRRELVVVWGLGVLLRSLTGAQSCVKGFQQEKGKCVDVDECQNEEDDSDYDGPCGPNAKCFNTEGSYYCRCEDGFRSTSTVHFTADFSATCSDINECLDDRDICGPNATCYNNIPDYTCYCKDGFASSNGTKEFKKGVSVSCRDVDECLQKDICGKHATCTNSEGSYSCVCYEGFVLSGNPERCEEAQAVNRSSTEPFVRLVGGDGRCRGRLQVKVAGRDWSEVVPGLVPLRFGNRVCEALDCGAAVTARQNRVGVREAVHLDYGACENSSLIDCFSFDTALSDASLQLNCADSVRLVGGRSLCSGSLQIRDQSLNQSWPGVCEGALGRRGAEVVCRELGCGTPLLQGAHSPLGQTFHCEGNESALMDCPRTRTRPETCPTLNLTCEEPLRLLGGASRCEGNVEVKYSDEWRPVSTLHDPWDLEAVAVVCRDMDCGTVVSTGKKRNLTLRYGWIVSSACVKTAAVRDCIQDDDPYADDLDLVCSDLLTVPEVSVSEGVGEPRAKGGVWVQMGAGFRVKCSVEPQYPGGSFQLLSPTLNRTVPAVNHTAHFLFTDASPAHKGNYTCVYFLHVFNHSFTANWTLHIRPGESDAQLLVRALILLLLMPLNFVPYFYYRQATRGHQRRQRARRHRAAP